MNLLAGVLWERRSFSLKEITVFCEQQQKWGKHLNKNLERGEERVRERTRERCVSYGTISSELALLPSGHARRR